MKYVDVSHYAGFDWASDHHDVVILDRSVAIVEEFRFDHTPDGWIEFRERIRKYPALGVAVETSRSLAVDELLGSGVAVFPVNPASAAEYRKRHAASGAKTDRIDAWSLADALRVDGATWGMLQPMDPDTLLLRLLTRDESRFIQDRTALVNRLRAALREYYPAALEAFEDWTVPSAWAFVERFPTPEALASVGKRAWEKFLHAHKLYRPGVQERRMEIFRRAMEFHGAAAVSSAKSLQALALIRMLRLLDAQLKEYRRRIEDAFAKHPDHDMFGSLPGLGDKIPPRLLAEIGSDRERFDTPGALQCTAGTAPVTVQSGKRRSVHMRHACNKHLRDAVHWLADVCRKACPWAQAYYEKKKVEGNSHQAALRCLGNRWLDILWKMWQTRTAYDPELHQRNQIAHGSWVFQLLPETAPETSHETP